MLALRADMAEMRAELVATTRQLAMIQAALLRPAPLDAEDFELLEAMRETIEPGVAFYTYDVQEHAENNPRLKGALAAAGLEGETRTQALGQRLGKLDRAGVLMAIQKDDRGRRWALPT